MADGRSHEQEHTGLPGQLCFCAPGLSMQRCNLMAVFVKKCPVLPAARSAFSSALWHCCVLLSVHNMKILCKVLLEVGRFGTPVQTVLHAVAVWAAAQGHMDREQLFM